ncbi:hypothetical protein VC629_26780, partial [Citrobacter freundii]|nr:hypothetical protein [Citrobacter freundii]MEB0724487.1 hypothetical protein [Citrobacter freundii]
SCTPCYHGSEVPQLAEPSKKPTPQSVFSFLEQETTTRDEGSQEDLINQTRQVSNLTMIFA